MVRQGAAILTILMAFVLGLALGGDAVAAEKVKLRTVLYGVKWETIELSDHEGHLIGVVEGKGIQSVIAGKLLCDGCTVRYGAVIDVETKIGTGACHGYGEVTDKDGDKYYYARRGKMLRMEAQASRSDWEGEVTIVRGTGKYEGIQGKGTWAAHVVAPQQWYYDEEIEVELPEH